MAKLHQITRLRILMGMLLEPKDLFFERTNNILNFKNYIL